MAVERYKWNCPDCGQAFGIKKGTAAPSLCPECSKKPQPASLPPAVETADKTIELTIPDLPSVEEEPHFLKGLASSETSQPTSTKTSSRHSSRRKSTSLRKLSMFYQALALLILVGSGVGTVFAISRKMDHWYAAAIFGTGIVLSLILAGIGVIIRVVINIEASTRD